MGMTRGSPAVGRLNTVRGDEFRGVMGEKRGAWLYVALVVRVCSSVEW